MRSVCGNPRVRLRFDDDSVAFEQFADAELREAGFPDAVRTQVEGVAEGRGEVGLFEHAVFEYGPGEVAFVEKSTFEVRALKIGVLQPAADEPLFFEPHAAQQREIHPARLEIGRPEKRVAIAKCGAEQFAVREPDVPQGRIRPSGRAQVAMFETAFDERTSPHVRSGKVAAAEGAVDVFFARKSLPREALFFEKGRFGFHGRFGFRPVAGGVRSEGRSSSRSRNSITSTPSG